MAKLETQISLELKYEKPTKPKKVQYKKPKIQRYSGAEEKPVSNSVYLPIPVLCIGG